VLQALGVQGMAAWPGMQQAPHFLANPVCGEKAQLHYNEPHG
jgi:hypothetical protein